MGTTSYSGASRRGAVHQFTVRGIPFGRCPAIFRVSKYALYAWLKRDGDPLPKPGVAHEADNRRRKRELARATGERGI